MNIKGFKPFTETANYMDSGKLMVRINGKKQALEASEVLPEASLYVRGFAPVTHRVSGSRDPNSECLKDHAVLILPASASSV